MPILVKSGHIYGSADILPAQFAFGERKLVRRRLDFLHKRRGVARGTLNTGPRKPVILWTLVLCSALAGSTLAKSSGSQARVTHVEVTDITHVSCSGEWTYNLAGELRDFP
ncbi:hypothetical protein PSPO01_13831 [Paraphaeosphaeria sporulosa]